MRKIHLLCNAHLDPCWLWEWEEGAAEALSTFRTAAELCEETDSLIFNHNEVTLYKWVEEYEPALFARIQRLVKAGRWHIMGGWYLQPDCNMPSGESFVRQILMGRLYFQDKFGVTPTTAINFDPFGHTRGLVQILKKSGYDAYLFGRPHEEICPLPPDGFIWVGYDGSEIAAHRFIGWYNAPLGKAREKIETWLKENPDREIGLILWGVGNHGGGPSRKDVREINAFIAECEDAEIVHSTPEAYFAEMAASDKKRPRRKQDLNSWAPGCYTSQIRLKQQHRLLENTLFMTEKMAAAAALQGLMAYPKDLLHEGLYDLLNAEFHDILPGSSVQPVEEAGLRMLHHGLEILSRIRARAFFALASGQSRAPEGEIPVFAYNPHPYPVEGIFECEFNLPDFNFEEEFTAPMVHLNGKALPCQVEKELGNQPIDWRKRCVFRATLAPSSITRFGCTLETVLPGRPKPQWPIENGYIKLKTDYLEVWINKNTGLMDKFSAMGVDVLHKNAFLPLVVQDDADSWSTVALKYHDVAGTFALAPPKTGSRVSGLGKVIDSVRVVEDGPVRLVVEAVFAYGDSFLIQTYKLPKFGTAIEVNVCVHWNEKDKMLKLAMPVAFEDAAYMGQVAYGRDVLPGEEREVVAQKWVAAVSKKSGMALTCINDGIYGSDFVGNAIRLTLLRSPAYSCSPFKDRSVVRPDGYTPRIDQGERCFRFWLQAGAKTERMGKVDREALTHNEKPFLLSFYPSGAGDPLQPAVIIEGNGVLLTTFKQAERSDNWILRLFESTGNARTITLSIPPLSIVEEIRFTSHEIKSLCLNTEMKTLQEVSLIEQQI